MNSYRYLFELAGRVPAVLALVLFRSAPFVGYLLATRSVRWPLRLGVVGSVGALVVLASRLRPGALGELAATPVMFAYLLVGALAIHWLRGVLGQTLIRAGGLFVFSAVAFVVVPAVYVHHAGVGAMVVLGWEMALSAHSYGVDTAGRTTPPTLSKGLFFLLVNPTFVYRECGSEEGPPEVRTDAVLRIATGGLVMLGRDGVLLAAARVPALRVVELNEVHDATGYARFCAAQLLLGVGLYCAHSGLASVQIGWMRLLGYRIPERYRYPFLAVSPQDFWQRWNAWVGRWAHHYLFVPVGHAAVRRWGGAAGPVGGVLAAFLGVGLLHDFGVWGLSASQGRDIGSLRFSAIFVAFAVALVMWRYGSRLVARVLGAPSPSTTRARALVARAVCLQLICLFSWIAIPVLRSDHLPPVLERSLAHWRGAR